MVMIKKTLMVIIPILFSLGMLGAAELPFPVGNWSFCLIQRSWL
jgi:hypothetical protein